MTRRSKLVITVRKAFFEPSWRRLILEPGTDIIGRSPEAHVILPDRLVSRKHARISYYDGKWYIQDLGSRNGTYIGGEDIRGKGPVPIPDEGVEVVVGTTLLELRPLGEGESEKSESSLEKGKESPQGE